VVAHAGEEGPAAYVREAVEVLQVERVDHGNAAMDDASLLALLAERQIALTLCPLSNLKLNVIKTIGEHPLKKMLDAGLRVTVNSDDPSYFGGYVNDNYLACQAALGLSRSDLLTLARNSVWASFMPEQQRQRVLSRIEAYDLQAPAWGSGS
jgi:adenosine deaminase